MPFVDFFERSLKNVLPIESVKYILSVNDSQLVYFFLTQKLCSAALFSFAPPAPYVSPSFSLYGDAAWRERLTPRPLMSFLDTQDLLTNSSSSSAPSGDLGVGGSSKGGGAKGHG